MSSRTAESVLSVQLTLVEATEAPGTDKRQAAATAAATNKRMCVITSGSLPFLCLPCAPPPGERSRLNIEADPPGSAAGADTVNAVHLARPFRCLLVAA